MHKIQNNILKTLLFKEKARFSELNTDNISNDHFTFHLKRLLEQKLVEKNQQGFYCLTIIGKEFANRLDTDAKEVDVERQAKLAVLVVCVDDSGKEIRYLVQQRLKHPSFGFYGFVTGKIKWGETVYEAGQRELKEETGLDAELDLAGIEHKIDYSDKNELLEDKYFYVMKGTNFAGQLLESFEGGKNIWLLKQEIEKLPDLFDDVLKIIQVIDKGKFRFFEDKYNVNGY
jgi:8-oxo-dGTP pyrophosphatase MutT (NUDIX family)